MVEELNSLERRLETDGHYLPIEDAILHLLQSGACSGNRGIDLPQLQNDCLGLGFTQREFSRGFVRLLSKRLLEPCGDFVYQLSAEGRRQPSTESPESTRRPVL